MNLVVIPFRKPPSYIPCADSTRILPLLPIADPATRLLLTSAAIAIRLLRMVAAVIRLLLTLTATGILVTVAEATSQLLLTVLATRRLLLTATELRVPLMETAIALAAMATEARLLPMVVTT